MAGGFIAWADEMSRPMPDTARYWHGTSDALKVEGYLRPPVESGIQREARKKYTNVVFFTTSKKSARQYAKKACEKYGGRPELLEVVPIGDFSETSPGEYIADCAKVLMHVVF